MKGASLKYDESSNALVLTLNPSQFNKAIESKAVLQFVRTSEYSHLYSSETEIKSATEKANHHFKSKSSDVVSSNIGEKRNAEVEFTVSEDAMTALLRLTAPFGGAVPSTDAIQKMAESQGIVRGLGKRHIANALDKLSNTAPGEVIETVVAKGLPARDGVSSKLKPLVPNALERVLRPQASGSSRVDMRNLGDVICVKANTPVLERLAPGKGRSGFTVKGKVLESKPGDWQPIKLGDGTAVSDSNENIVVATIAGMPKFKDLIMSVDDTFTCQGVNVGTGNINYDGAVLVNGDVTEKMVITATGDVTVNGFVESATIHAGGDIVITEGAMGKVNDEATEFSCNLQASGSVHVQHGQGIDITCGGNITIGRQLAYSKLDCKGDIIVGQIDNPMGNLFACDIISQKSIVAGTLGAVSGSHLTIDFSRGFEQLMERKEALDEMLKHLRKSNSKHKEKIDFIKAKLIPKNLRGKVDDAIELFENESQMLNWLEIKALEMKTAKKAYTEDIKLIANKRIYSGVAAKLNNRNWRSEREYGRSKVSYDDHQWTCEPIV
ncbi:DUF342 domain-containing protein [Alteromonas oceanisediminis]|uniref:DUF342 domain-containing protein n=1 Tax=Alteromonas oceanisediminis TaxID=2836180 RepID=UPI001BDA5621|nr:FapA family protein [Alteromonas oceanisediminis]MBT0587232.1 DUF342 domain-containing protein [Alteromonas oceanisediminis]